MSLLERIDGEVERRSLLKHPFYRKWSEGGLTLASLAGYSMEYFQLVKAVPDLVNSVHSLATPRDARLIARNLEEERTHIDPWVRFAGSLGVSREKLETHSGAPSTMNAVRSLGALTRSSFGEGVAALYAYEKQLPEISRSKIEGLRKFYGLNRIDATEYFELHEEADVRHAALWRSLLARSATSEERERDLESAAVGSLEAQNALLDSVMESYC